MLALRIALLIAAACVLLIVPWRLGTDTRYEPMGYSLLFVAPDEVAKVDLTRYFVQIFAAGTLAVLLVGWRRGRL